MFKGAVKEATCTIYEISGPPPPPPNLYMYTKGVLSRLTLSRAKPIITVHMLCKIKVLRVAGKHS